MSSRITPALLRSDAGRNSDQTGGHSCEAMAAALAARRKAGMSNTRFDPETNSLSIEP